MEAVFLLVWKMREEREFQKWRGILTGLLNQKGSSEKQIQEAFEDLKNAFFPFNKNKKATEIQQQKEVLKSWIANGPLELTPMVDLNSRKNQRKLERGQAILRRRAALLQHGQLERLDPYETAKRRPRGAF